jgi:solute carrier family 25 folate transporter 32
MTRLYSSLLAGVGSGALASIICAPLDLIRTRLQVWTDVKHSPTVAIPQMLRDIIRQDGITGCFRGLGATLVTVPAFWGVYWPVYDDCKRRWRHDYPHWNPMFVHMLAAVSAGVVSDIICNPMFVVRTRLQTEALHNMTSGKTKKLTMLQTANGLYQEGGIFIFWRGMTANLMGLSHVGVQFPVYEKLKKFFRNHKQHESTWDLLLASGLSKMTACILTYPHEVIRSRMMDARTRVGFIDTCGRIYVGEGFSGFYTGLPITLIRVIPNTCVCIYGI